MKIFSTKHAVLCAAVFLASWQANAQTSSTRAQLESNINAEITTNGTGQITGAILNKVLQDQAASTATLLDANSLPLANLQNITGPALLGSATSGSTPVSTVPLGSGVATALGIAPNAAGGFVSIPNTDSCIYQNSASAVAGCVVPNSTLQFDGSGKLGIDLATPNTWTGLQTFNDGIGAQITFPGSFGATPTDLWKLNIGSYPLSGEWAAGILQGVVSAMIVPSTYTQQPYPNSPFASFVDNKNTVSGSSAVGFFSAAFAEGSGVWNFNGVCQNTAPQYLTSGGSGNGENFQICNGLEVNSNIFKIGASIPAGQLNGIKFIGTSEVDPSGDSYVAHVFPLGTGVPWDFGLACEIGACSVGVDLQSIASGNGQPSSLIQLHSVSSGSVTQTSSIQELANGAFNFVSSTGIIAFGDGTNNPLIINNSAGAVFPGATNSYDLGTTSFKWRNLFVSGNVTIGPGSAITSSGPGGALTAPAFQSGAVASQTCTVDQAKTLVFTNGILTGGTCNT